MTNAPAPTLVLAGRSVVIAHEDAFHGQYLADVIADSGAAVLGPVRRAVDGMALLDADRPPSALVLGRFLTDNGSAAMARAASARGMVMLLVQPVREAPPFQPAPDASLTAPYAGFQVVDALAGLLTRGRGTAWSSSPQRRGH